MENETDVTNDVLAKISPSIDTEAKLNEMLDL